MTNRDRILAAILAAPGLTDAELRERTGIEPHQQVNQICRRLHQDGLIVRTAGPHGYIGNYPAAAGSVAPSRLAAPATHAEPDANAGRNATARRWWRRRASKSDSIEPPSLVDMPLALPRVQDTLVVFPCSGRKTSGGGPSTGPSILNLLPAQLADELRTARQQLAPKASLDERARLPAWRRYSGTLYTGASSAIGKAVERHQPMVILSGGYGLVIPEEPIGSYDRVFTLTDWPQGLLQRCLVALCDRTGMTEVVAFCARTTGYAELVRSTNWAQHHLRARLVSPVMATRGGAQVVVPRLLGTALTGYLSDDHVPHRVDAHTLAIETVG